MILTALVLAVPALASSVRKMELPEMVSKSDSVVQGTVESVEARWESDLIFTYASIRVDESFKGAPRRALLIRQPGGKLGALNLTVSGTPQFKAGDRVIVFLQNQSNGTFDIVGLGQGKYDLVDNLAISNSAGATIVDPKTGRMSETPSVQKVPLDAFKARIRELAK